MLHLQLGLLTFAACAKAKAVRTGAVRTKHHFAASARIAAFAIYTFAKSECVSDLMRLRVTFDCEISVQY